MGKPFVPLLVKSAPGPNHPAAATVELPPVDIVLERSLAFDAGKARGIAETQPKIAALEAQLADARALFGEVEKARREALDQAASDVAAMVVALARKVIGDSLALHPDAVSGIVKGAMDRLPQEDELVIRVPADAVERVRASVPERHRAHVVPDASISGGCIVETRFVSIEGSLETAMHGIEAAAAAWLAGRA
jgi:flagellar biosynthesis/type III secretory pathway protein FliH